jgi:hypothetical protein
MIDLQAPSMAVIIGAWKQHQQHNIKQCLKNIVTFVNNHLAFDVVVLSGNHVTVNHQTQGNNPWYDNSRRIFLEEQGVDWMRRLWDKSETGTVSWEEAIRDHPWKAKCVSIWEQWQLGRCFTKSPTIGMPHF